MATVEVPVNGIAYVSSVDGRIEVVVQSQPVNTFAEAVEIIVFWQVRDKLDELVLVDECSVLGCEDSVAC
jgi:hypothetical protein